MVVARNASMHASQTVAVPCPSLETTGVHLVTSPSSNPEVSRIEPEGHDVKYHELPVRSGVPMMESKQAVDAALACAAQQLGGRLPQRRASDSRPHRSDDGHPGLPLVKPRPQYATITSSSPSPCAYTL
jgi:hypothetical protein